MPLDFFTLKKQFFFSLLVLTLLSISTYSLAEDEEEFKKITVYNWSDYMPEGVLENFTMLTNIDVDYQTYDSNEEMYERIKNQEDGEVDVVIPSGYYISKMQREGLLRPLELYRIHNFNQLDPSLLNRSYDWGNKYSLPYVWGSTGIAVNTAKIDPKLQVTSWSNLWDEQWRGRLMLTDDVRDVFHLGLIVNGYSTNSRDAFEIQDAAQSLSNLMPSVSAIVADSPHEALLDGRADIGMMWSGEALLAQKKNPMIQYIIPEEGPFFWTDNLAIPADSDNPADAHQFIDFMLSRRIAVRTLKELGYATANTDAKLSSPAAVRNNPIIFPEASLVISGDFQRDPGDQAIRLMNNIWQVLRKEMNDAVE